MTLGLLQIKYHSIVLPYDDETTPLSLTGKKMLPVLKVGERAIPESLDIMAALDEKNVLKIRETLGRTEFKAFENLINEIGSIVHSLAMPFWIYTAEFSESSRDYFKKKKEVKRGPFRDLVAMQPEFLKQMGNLFLKFENDLKPFYLSEEITLKDILLASHLWGLYSVPEYQLPPKLHSYLQLVKSECRFNYQKPLWEP
jgi:glutaredoxin 2